MRNIKTAGIIYFTGTGGTEQAAKAIEVELRNRGIETLIKEISVNDETKYSAADMLFFLYPVHAGDASEAVYNYIRSLPNMPIPLTDCVILSVSAGGEVLFNTACRSKVKRKLNKKGFKPIYEDMIMMPNNFAMSFTDEESSLMLYALPYKVKKIIERVMSGEVRKTTPKIFDSVLRTIIEPFKLFAKINGRCLKANDKCTGCGLCAEKCPRGNIKIQKNKPIFDWKCVMCMRCVYLCPVNAIKNTFTKAITLKSGFDINKYKDLSEKITDFSEESITRATKDNKALHKYLLEILKTI